jgi:hypothetical protein
MPESVAGRGVSSKAVISEDIKGCRATTKLRQRTAFKKKAKKCYEILGNASSNDCDKAKKRR